jgi:hypothetical protein
MKRLFNIPVLSLALVAQGAGAQTRLHVRFGSLANIMLVKTVVRFASDSDQKSDIA